ncbi:hypothetical protein E4K10_14600 [Streptomyces sp. T1317-0309]|nr:hypothetical protein E4K10_14600 [Streptomyces sp. T1317-0309]
MCRSATHRQQPRFRVLDRRGRYRPRLGTDEWSTPRLHRRPAGGGAGRPDGTGVHAARPAGAAGRPGAPQARP